MKVFIPFMLPLTFLCALLFPMMSTFTITGCGGRYQGTDQMKPCYSHFLAEGKGVMSESEALREELAATGGRKCYRPSDFPKGSIPSYAVMRKVDGTVMGENFAAAWSDAQKGIAWTVSLCQ
jgi:hypothetical protein